MRSKIFLILVVFVHIGATSQGAIQAPVLKWQNGGCYSSWCETGWYSSPAVEDLDGDGTIEVIGATYSVFLINGEDGTLQDSYDPPGTRVWPGVVIADIDGDADKEILTAHGGGYLHVFDHAGENVWTQQPSTSELRSLAVFDLDSDGTLEIITSAAISGRINTWIYEHNGTLRTGWPQLVGGSGYAAGVYNDSTAVGDINSDGFGEVIVPSDTHYICAYDSTGVQIQANSIYGDKTWCAVGVWESLATEIRGWGFCDGVRNESYRTNFSNGGSIIADVNGDQVLEIVATGNVYDCHVGHPPGKYTGVYILSTDRSRFNQSPYNWETLPADMGAPLIENYTVIESVPTNPVAEDIDGDGNREIIYASYDGRVHALWLDKTEHHNWPYSVYKPSEGFFRFASEPVIVDFDHDGYAEVVFASWVQKGTNQTGKLHILDYRGIPLHEVNLPLAFGSPDWNGGLAAPTIANIDDDEDIEIVINTAHSGFIAFDMPNTPTAQILWGTGRGSFHRNGVPPIPAGDINASFEVEIDDAILALQITIGAATPLTRVPMSADVNGDRKVGVEEVIYILQKISRMR